MPIFPKGYKKHLSVHKILNTLCVLTFYKLFIVCLNTVAVYLLFLKTIVLLREMYILYTFYFSDLGLRKFPTVLGRFLSLNCLRFE